MGRALDPEAFGVFALAFALLVLAERLQHGFVGALLLATPMTSHDSPDALSGAALGFQIRLVAAIAGLVAVVGWGFSLTSDWPGLVAAATCLPLSLAGTQARDFSRYVCYRRGQAGYAALLGSVSAVIQITLQAILLAMGRLSMATGILAIGLGGIAAFALSIPLVRPLAERPRAVSNRRWQRVLWLKGGRLAGSHLFSWGATQGFLFLTALAVGTGQAGVLRAAQSLFGPTQFISSGLFNTLAPAVARRINEGHGPWASARPSVVLISLAVILYCAFLALIPDHAMTVLFGLEYAGYELPVRILAGGYALGGIASAWFLVLVVLGRTDLVLRAQAVTLVMSLIIAFPLVHAWGLMGAALGLALVHLVRSLVMGFLARTAAR